MLGVTHEFSGVTRTLICMGTVFAGKGRGMAKLTQGLPLSRPSRVQMIKRSSAK
jgi:hypothetical protein